MYLSRKKTLNKKMEMFLVRKVIRGTPDEKKVYFETIPTFNGFSNFDKKSFHSINIIANRLRMSK